MLFLMSTTHYLFSLLQHDQAEMPHCQFLWISRWWWRANSVNLYWRLWFRTSEISIAVSQVSFWKRVSGFRKKLIRSSNICKYWMLRSVRMSEISKTQCLRIGPFQINHMSPNRKFNIHQNHRASSGVPVGGAIWVVVWYFFFYFQKLNSKSMF